LVLAAAASAAVVAGTIVLGRRWLATGFDAAGARALGARSALPDAALIGLIALGVVSALSAIGALLAAALFVVPAATVRLVVWRLRAWQLGSIALAAADGVVGLWLSVKVNVPPGAAVSVLAGGVFALVAAARALGPRRAGALALAGSALVVAGCGSSSGGASVVATTTQIADWTRAVAGSTLAVHQILQPNTDPHEYEPRPVDVEAVADAKLVLESGDGLD